MRSGKFKVVLFSEINSPFGLDFLRELIRHETVAVVGVVTQPDDRLCIYYRGSSLTGVNLKEEAVKRSIPVLQPRNVNKATKLLKRFNADYFIVANYQQILSRQVVQLPKRFTINFHPSLLPAYAGLRPWFWMARHHERQGGVSAIALNEIIDGGDIITQIPICLRGDESAEQIRVIHFRESITLLNRVVAQFSTLERRSFIKQDFQKRTYYGRKEYEAVLHRPYKPSHQDGHITGKASRDLFLQPRGCNPG